MRSTFPKRSEIPSTALRDDVGDSGCTEPATVVGVAELHPRMTDSPRVEAQEAGEGSATALGGRMCEAALWAGLLVTEPGKPKPRPGGLLASPGGMAAAPYEGVEVELAGLELGGVFPLAARDGVALPDSFPEARERVGAPGCELVATHAAHDLAPTAAGFDGGRLGDGLAGAGAARARCWDGGGSDDGQVSDEGACGAWRGGGAGRPAGSERPRPIVKPLVPSGPFAYLMPSNTIISSRSSRSVATLSAGGQASQSPWGSRCPS